MIDISIIVTVYNMEKYLERCLNSIFMQEGDNYEVLLIDDSSSDSSFQILNFFGHKYKDKCRVIKNEINMGLGSVRYIGLQESKGMYVTFVDADDYLQSNFCKLMTYKLNQDDYDIIYGGMVRIKESGEIIAKGSFSPYLEGELTEQMKQAFMIQPVGSLAGMLIKKDFLVKWKYCFIEGQNYDEDIIAHIYPLMAKKIGIVTEVLYNWVYRSGSMSTEYKSHKRDRLRSNLYFYRNVEKMGLIDKYKEEIEFVIAYYYYLGTIRSAVSFSESSVFLKQELKTTRYVMKKYFPNYINNKYLHCIEKKEMLDLAEANDKSYDRFLEVYYSQYNNYYNDNNKKIKDIFDYCRRRGYIVAIWGAGKKGRTFLHCCDPKGEYIKFVFDKNELLWNKKIDDVHQVYDYNSLLDSVDVVIVINCAHYLSIYKEINKKVKYLIDLDNYLDFNVSFDMEVLDNDSNNRKSR